MNTDRQLSPTADRDLPRPASAREIDAMQRAVRRAQARLAASRPLTGIDNSNVQEIRESFDRHSMES